MRVSKRTEKQSSRRAGKKFWLMKLGLLILLLPGIYFGMRYMFHIINYRVFPVKEVVFFGNRHLTDSELKALIGPGDSERLASISGKELSAKLLKSPWIKAVNLRRELPYRFLIKIEEAVPSALLEMNGKTFFVDDSGNLLEEIKSESVPFMPVISGDPYKNKDSFLEALNIVRVMKEKGFMSMKDRIEIIIPRNSGPEDISMQVDGTLVKIGYGEYEEKLERLIELEDEIAKRGIPVDYIDLRFANRVVVKPISEVVR